MGARDDRSEIPDPSKTLAIYRPLTNDVYMPTYDQLMLVMGCKEDEEDLYEENPYGILGVKFTATHEEIKEAFTTLARMYHPDKFPEDPKAAKFRFDRIKKAYDALRSADVRAKTDSRIVQKGLKGDLLSVYASETYADRKKIVDKMVQVPDHLNVDRDADPGMNVAFKEKGVAVIQYYDYRMPFPVPEGRLAAAEIDNVYGLTDAMPECEFHLAEWRSGKSHIVRYAESDSGASTVLRKDAGVFHGLEPGLTYFLLVQEGEKEATKEEAKRALQAREKEARELASRILHKCEDEQIYVFGLGNVCRICTDKDADFLT